MEPHHRKIDLQSPQDLTYLLANINNAAQQKLDIHFPPSAAPKDEEDAFRTKVEQLVQEYITHTLTLALPSLSINGLPASPSLLHHSSSSSTNPSTSTSTNPSPTPSHLPDNTQHYETYDPRLAAKLRALYATLETETTKVAEMRREVPSKAAGLYVERLRREMENEERVFEEGVRGVGMSEGLGVGVEGGGSGLGERVEEVRRAWEGGVRGLEGLGGVTEAVAKLERVREVVEGVEGGR